ncbi:prolipoprotein diacylglyceryl transferase [Thiospirochaeta perfilievii]|uniref:Phosphatidylglycerol--prolipoprotein diacylglyceryl transferase n=1 Tax=Thiospirochaeta perfilievii TaxID=252967 RepID=A0A5C1QDN9_9SPIO|nr:prolipoprotein diacylglyceryl transferase [Thiospirochaeta perfilievii]QEN04844.1 prolipoprotein diacylglyceryl transferase [Thiospirochaeta perfilievii]
MSVFLYINYPSWITPEIIPGFFMRWYAVMYLVALGITYVLFMKQLKDDKYEIKKEVASDYIFYIMIGLIIGARIFSTLVYETDDYYRNSPWLIFWPFRDGSFVGFQGMSYHGGVIGGVVAALIFSKIKKVSFLDLADYLCTALPLGFTFGRLGNFINGELYGRITKSPLGMVFNTTPISHRFHISNKWVVDFANDIGMDISTMTLVNLPRHPSQLYEAFFEGIFLWFILWFVVRRFKSFKGFMLSMYLTLFGLFRFCVEYFRQPDDGLDFPIQLGPHSFNYEFKSLLNITTGQIFSFMMFIAGILLFIAFKLYSKKVTNSK